MMRNAFNGGDLLMIGGATIGILTDAMDWLATNQSFWLALPIVIIGAWKSWQQGKLIKEQRQTEKLKQEELKAEIDQLKNN